MLCLYVLLGPSGAWSSKQNTRSLRVTGGLESVHSGGLASLALPPRSRLHVVGWLPVLPRTCALPPSLLPLQEWHAPAAVPPCTSPLTLLSLISSFLVYYALYVFVLVLLCFDAISFLCSFLHFFFLLIFPEFKKSSVILLCVSQV